MNGVEIAIWEWPGQGQPVLFCHATSFHARIWDQVIARLPGHRCFTFDARGHGRSSKPAPPYAWRDFGADVAAVAESLGLSGAVGVGHSMGGHAVTLGAALNLAAFSALLLFDPVIRAKDQYLGPWGKTGFVAKRRNRWASPEEMFERFKERPPFDSWDRKRAAGLLPIRTVAGWRGATSSRARPKSKLRSTKTARRRNRTFTPRSPRSRSPSTWFGPDKFRDPANVMGSSPTTPDLAASFARGADTLLQEHSHFIPMESPELVAKMIEDALALL